MYHLELLAVIEWRFRAILTVRDLGSGAAEC